MQHFRTFSPDNQFKFACPVFGAEVELAGCLKLREVVTVGKRPDERRGCQACMRASKCPVIRLVQNMPRMAEDPGMFSAEPRVGQLKPDLLAFIKPILVHEPLLDEYQVPPTERELILAANERAGTGKPAGKGKAAPIAQLEPVSGTKPRRTKAEAPDALTEAAMTGDMSAAVTAASEKAPATGAKSPVAEKSPESAAGGVRAKDEQSHQTPARTPPTANVGNAGKQEIAKSSRETPVAPSSATKAPSLLELARARRAAAAA